MSQSNFWLEFYKGLIFISMLVASNTVFAFSDILVTPAMKSEKVATSPLIAIANAGQRMVVAGWRGNIAYTDDSGKSWRQAKVPVSVDITGLSFTSPKNGWAIGHSGVLLSTSDAGETWVKKLDGVDVYKLMSKYYSDQKANGRLEADKNIREVDESWKSGPELPWLGIGFSDEKTGYISGPFNMLMRTDDAGLTWTPLLEKTNNPDGFHFNSIKKIGEHFYAASERGMVFRSNADLTFMPSSTGYRGSFFGVCGEGRIIYSYGLKGTIFKSSDAGDTWEKQNSGTVSAVNGCYVEGESVFFVTNAGEIITAKLTSAEMKMLPGISPSPKYGITRANSGALVFVGIAGVGPTASTSK